METEQVSLVARNVPFGVAARTCASRIVTGGAALAVLVWSIAWTLDNTALLFDVLTRGGDYWFTHATAFGAIGVALWGVCVIAKAASVPQLVGWLTAVVALVAVVQFGLTFWTHPETPTSLQGVVQAVKGVFVLVALVATLCEIFDI